jgi:hypothetical protein
MLENIVRKKTNYFGMAVLGIVAAGFVLGGYFSGIWGMRKNYSEMRALERMVVVSEYRNTLRDSASLDSIARDMYRSSLERFPSLEEESGDLKDSINHTLKIAHLSPEVIRYEQLEAENGRILGDAVKKTTFGILGGLGLVFAAVLYLAVKGQRYKISS